jgi:hypothetical protein
MSYISLRLSTFGKYFVLNGLKVRNPTLPKIFLNPETDSESTEAGGFCCGFDGWIPFPYQVWDKLSTGWRLRNCRKYYGCGLRGRKD